MLRTLKKKKLLKKPLKLSARRAYTLFRSLIFTRHPSHAPLRTKLPLMPFRSVVRLGSITQHTRDRIECNSAAGVKNSASKLLMKRCFSRVGAKTAKWYVFDTNRGFVDSENIAHTSEHIPYPIIAKSLHGSRGVGNFKLDTQGALEQWMHGKTLSNYIFEEFATMSREYRLHVTKEGCFYACRKLLRNDVPDNTWQRHDDNCVWIIESNPSFKKPNNWQAIVDDCIKAQKALGLDICAFDVMVQGSKGGIERTNPEWIICESCSAPSFGDITAQKYLQEIPKLLKRKYNERRNS